MMGCLYFLQPSMVAFTSPADCARVNMDLVQDQLFRRTCCPRVHTDQVKPNFGVHVAKVKPPLEALWGPLQ